MTSDPAIALPAASGNALVWDGRARGHYEVWYLALADRASRTGCWIRYTLTAPLAGPSRAALWLATFDRDQPERAVALIEEHPIDALRAAADPFRIAIGDASLTGHGALGVIDSGKHRVRWDLAWEPSPTVYPQLPAIAYRLPIGGTRVVSPNLDVAARGTIEIDGRRIAIDGSRLTQSHLWGRRHAAAWAWGHCADFDRGEDLAIEALTARLDRLGGTLPPITLLGVRLDGRMHALNGLGSALRRRGRFGPWYYEFSARGRDLEVQGEFSCRPCDVLAARYHDPDGRELWCGHATSADLTVRLKITAAGSRREMIASGTAHFEVAGRDRPGGVDRQFETGDNCLALAADRRTGG